MQALILVGGEGTRLRPLTDSVPKPVLPLAGRPLISYTIEWLSGHGVDEVVLACGFLADSLRAALGDGGGGDPRIRYLTEPEALGTGGAIKFASELLEDRFIALNGDVLSDLDATALWRAHEASGATATIALHEVEDPSSYGLVHTGADGAVLEFTEKPDAAESGPGQINAGVYVLEKTILDGVPTGKVVSIERQVFPGLVGSGLHGLCLDGYWIDVGTPERYLQATWDILEGRITTTGARSPRSGVLIDSSASVDPQASVGPRAVISAGCRIGPGAVVEDSVLLAGCEIGAGAEVRGSILAPGAGVGPGARSSGVIIASGERVGER